MHVAEQPQERLLSGASRFGRARAAVRRLTRACCCPRSARPVPYVTTLAEEIWRERNAAPPPTTCATNAAVASAATSSAAPSAVPSAASDYFGVEALLQSVESGAIAPLRGRWLISMQEAGGTLGRRQDLPAEAFWSASELRKFVSQLGTEDYGVAFVALSYRWLSREHCDPEGFHLAIVAAVARLYVDVEHRKESPLVRAMAKAGLPTEEADFALFWDFASLHQTPRAPEQEALFRHGLRASNVRVVALPADHHECARFAPSDYADPALLTPPHLGMVRPSGDRYLDADGAAQRLRGRVVRVLGLVFCGSGAQCGD